MVPPEGQHSYVLVVEDEPTIQELLVMFLELEGYAVQAVADGHAALDVLHTHPMPCCILLDMRMPIMDGPAFVLALRNDPQFAHIPIIAMSAQADVVEMEADIEAAAYLEKPFGLATLHAQLQRVCSKDKQ
jgi:CheY-like chemotaxis protein